MSDNDKDDEQPKLKLVFAPGCFDDFEGTQEELNDLIAHITELAESGELLENATAIEDFEEVEDEVLDEILPMLTSGNIRH